MSFSAYSVTHISSAPSVSLIAFGARSELLQSTDARKSASASGQRSSLSVWRTAVSTSAGAIPLIGTVALAVEVIHLSILERICLDEGIQAKRAAGILSGIIAHSAPARNPIYAGGRSVIVKIMTPRGQHIATWHEIRMPDSSIPHSHPKDYTRRDCSRVRAG